MRDSPLAPEVRGFVACGAVVRRDALLACGGFEPRFQFGGEEELLALDLAAARWRLRYADDAVAHHAPADGERDGRDFRDLRNALWTAWLRRPAAVTPACTRSVLADAGASAGGPRRRAARAAVDPAAPPRRPPADRTGIARPGRVTGPHGDHIGQQDHHRPRHHPALGGGARRDAGVRPPDGRRRRSGDPADRLPGGAGEDQLEHISWDEWFQKFDSSGLAFLYQEQKSSGEGSTFFKLINR
jgi:hypothetical protein